jgi:cytoskeletal protein CcmA (bactofilin family)
MFGKTKGDGADSDREAPSTQAFQRTASVSSSPDSAESASSISAGMSIVGKIVSDGTVNIFGRVEGEVKASTIVIADGAQVDGDIVAEDLAVAGRVKGTIHANRVRLNGTAVVEGDIFHRSLAIEEHARFEGSSRREETAIDTKSRAQAGRAQSMPVTASDAARKSNGNGDALRSAE